MVLKMDYFNFLYNFILAGGLTGIAICQYLNIQKSNKLNNYLLF